jgi:hypothetical protein
MTMVSNSVETARESIARRIAIYLTGSERGWESGDMPDKIIPYFFHQDTIVLVNNAYKNAPFSKE